MGQPCLVSGWFFLKSLTSEMMSPWYSQMWTFPYRQVTKQMQPWLLKLRQRSNVFSKATASDSVSFLHRMRMWRTKSGRVKRAKILTETCCRSFLTARVTSLTLIVFSHKAGMNCFGSGRICLLAWHVSKSEKNVGLTIGTPLARALATCNMFRMRDLTWIASEGLARLLTSICYARFKSLSKNTTFLLIGTIF